MQTVKNAHVDAIPGTSFGIIFPVLHGTREELCELMQFVPQTYIGKVIPVAESENGGTVYVASVEGDFEEAEFISALLENAFGDADHESASQNLSESVEYSYPKSAPEQKEIAVHNVLNGKVFDRRRDAKSVADYCIGHADVQVQKITLPYRKAPGWVVIAGGKVYQESGYFA